MKSLILLAALSLSLLNAVQAQPPVRLKQVTTEQFGLNRMVPMDSTVYYYSSNNKGYLSNEIFFNDKRPEGTTDPRIYFNGDFSPNIEFNITMQYDSAIKYRLSHIGSPKYAAVIQEIANNQIIKCTTGFHNYLTNTWANYRTSSFSYAGGRIVMRTDSGSGFSTYKYYYGNSGAADSLVITYGGKVWKVHYVYSSGMLTETICYPHGDATSKILYSYNGNGMPVTQIMLIYDSGLAVWDTIGGVKQYYDTFSRLTREEKWNDSGKTWLTVDIAYDNNNNRVEDIIHWDYYMNGSKTGLIKAAKKQYGYNSFGLISDFEVKFWNDTLQSWVYAADSLFGHSQKVLLEYELFWPQDVSTVQQDEEHLVVFPSPASGFITAKAEHMPAGKLEAMIYDLQGRMLRRWTDQCDGRYHRVIPTQELPAGTYVLQLNAKDVSRKTQFIIYR